MTNRLAAHIRLTLAVNTATAVVHGYLLRRTRHMHCMLRHRCAAYTRLDNVLLGHFRLTVHAAGRAGRSVHYHTLF